MATPSSPTVSDGEAPIPNHQTASTVGGASSTPTPANNVGGGSGWGDKGFLKGNHGPGHISAATPRETIYNFLSLKGQKEVGEKYVKDRYNRAAGYEKPTTAAGEPTCESEDHSFMAHKPGCPETLPGWSKVKHSVEMMHKQGR